MWKSGILRSIGSCFQPRLVALPDGLRDGAPGQPKPGGRGPSRSPDRSLPDGRSRLAVPSPVPGPVSLPPKRP
jgi:hypothetical protein